jgi:hypothetical protein
MTMAIPPQPRDPWYRGYWTRYNRPYGGCGCLYSLLFFLAIWWLISLLYPPMWFWY